MKHFLAILALISTATMADTFCDTQHVTRYDYRGYPYTTVERHCYERPEALSQHDVAGAIVMGTIAGIIVTDAYRGHRHHGYYRPHRGHYDRPHYGHYDRRDYVRY